MVFQKPATRKWVYTTKYWNQKVLSFPSFKRLYASGLFVNLENFRPKITSISVTKIIKYQLITDWTGNISIAVNGSKIYQQWQCKIRGDCKVNSLLPLGRMQNKINDLLSDSLLVYLYIFVDQKKEKWRRIQIKNKHDIFTYAP